MSEKPNTEADIRPEPISTLNKFAVGTQNDRTVVLVTPAWPLSSEEALQLAAWLVAVNYRRIDEFQDLLKRVVES